MRANEHPPTAGETTGSDVEFDAVSVELGGRRVVDDVSVRLAAGSVVGLVGPNGSGKSSLLRTLYRASVPAAGTVRVDGVDIAAESMRATARRVAALAQDERVELDWTVGELVALGRHPHGDADTDAGRAACERARRQMGLDDFAGRSVLALSGGERQRVLLSRALAQETPVLVLDEPTNHLDLTHQIGLLRAVRSCGRTVVVALHDLNLAGTACDHVLLMDRGRLVAEGAPEDVLTPDLVEQVWGLRPQVLHSPDTGARHLVFPV